MKKKKLHQTPEYFIEEEGGAQRPSQRCEQSMHIAHILEDTEGHVRISAPIMCITQYTNYMVDTVAQIAKYRCHVLSLRDAPRRATEAALEASLFPIKGGARHREKEAK